MREIGLLVPVFHSRTGYISADCKTLTPPVTWAIENHR